ncbi:FAD binding domain-containing protein [Dactylosporangium roseum]|uniref:FAD binding domain-containing protein n=1 Tax=Dactylosporangium roseum TaxID=47989 RepID=A0ABY5Z0H0_9ACTN|nr:FAD binding domain-containing protein [Dactylosporangium roseum]UWZ34560.1 FAD binding domain-containing protein [Dactylosporangium roseum]
MSQVDRPRSWAEALALRSEHPEALVIAGGTDLMVAVNFGRVAPERLLDLTGVHELAVVDHTPGSVRVGAGVTFSRVTAELRAVVPGLALAARTVGSPQIRNRATLGGNLATASPAGDGLPPLVAAGALVEVGSVRGERTVPITDFFVGPKRTVLADDELIRGVSIPAATGPQQFAKVGTRNAMVIAVCSFALCLDVAGRRVGTGIGSAAPTPVRALAAEAFLEERLLRRSGWESRAELADDDITAFGRLAAEETRPIDDLRGTATYRRHAIAVLAQRTLRWTWAEFRKGDR